jgi:hypothetical protein
MDPTNDKSLEWIEAQRLVNDPRYQRPIYPTQVKKIASEFDPDLLGAIVISEREDGELYVIDGQHRLEALRTMGWEDQLVPCLVHRNRSLEEEAKIFAETQTKRKQLRPVEVFAAQLLAGDPVAVGIKHAVEEVDFVLNLTGSGQLDNGHMSCVSAMRFVWEKYGRGPDVLRETLRLIRDAWGVGAGPKGSVVLGVAQFVNAYWGQYDRRRLIHVMQALLQERLLALGTEQKRVNGVSHSVGVMRALLVAYNKNLTTNRLTAWEDMKFATRTRRAKPVSTGEAAPQPARTGSFSASPRPSRRRAPSHGTLNPV